MNEHSEDEHQTSLFRKLIPPRGLAISFFMLTVAPKVKRKQKLPLEAAAMLKFPSKQMLLKLNVLG